MGHSKGLSVWRPHLPLLILLPALPPTLGDPRSWLSTWPRAPCPPWTSLSPLSGAHMRAMRQRRRTRVLTTVSPMATSTTSVLGPDNPTGERDEDRVTCSAAIPCSSAPSRTLDIVPWPSCITGFRTTWALTLDPTLTPAVGQKWKCARWNPSN